MLSSKLLGSFVKSITQQQQLAQNTAVALVNANFFHTDSCKFGVRHGGAGRLYYNIMKERPLGPNKKLAPNVKYDDKKQKSQRTKQGSRIGPMENYRYIVHYPEDGKYTIKKLEMTRLGGRDPVTGRKIIGRVGGGSKRKWRWIDWQRLPEDWPRDGEDLVEKVVSINYDPNRKPMIALTGYDDKLRWQIATSGMKEGDLITTTWRIPKIPVKPIEGNSYPLGALPSGTRVCLLQKYHDSVAKSEKDLYYYNENTSGTLLKKLGDRVIVENSERMQYSFDQRCQCVVGQISIHPLKACHIGTPNRLRWLGIRPRSGLWHRKTGIHGRKIRAPPPVKTVIREEPSKDQTVVLTCKDEGNRGRIKQRKKPFPVEYW